MSAHHLVLLMNRVTATPGPLDTDCWLTFYTPGQDGYISVATNKGKRYRAHRLTYEIFVGPIPEGRVLDHLCRIKTCCNPWHVEPVTDLENSLRGEHPLYVASRSGVCLRGHDVLDDRNAYRRPGNGRRQCRTCINDGQRRRRAERNARAS